MVHRNSLEIPQFAFNQHHNSSCVYTTRAEQTALAAQHTLVHLLVCPLIFASAYQSMYLAEVERCEVARRTTCRAGATADTSLQFGQLLDDLVALAQIVSIDIYHPRARYIISEIQCHNNYFLRYSATLSAATIASFNTSPMLFGAVTVPA